MSSYSPVGDLIVMTICIVIAILVFFSYNRNTGSFKVFLAILGMLAIASVADVLRYRMMTADSGNYEYAVSLLGAVYQAALFAIFVLFVVYIAWVTEMSKTEFRPYLLGAMAIFLFEMIADTVLVLHGEDLSVAAGGTLLTDNRYFQIGYAAFVLLLTIMLYRVRERLYHKVMLGFYGTIGISLLIMILQGIHGQTSFTVVTFMYPVIAMLYIMHSNPYDAEIGSVDARALTYLVRSCFEKKREFIYMSLYLRSISEEGKETPYEMRGLIRKYVSSVFRGATLFQLGKGHALLVAEKRKNPDYEQKIRYLIQSFFEEYEKFHIDYKIVVGKSVEEVSRKNDYANLIASIHSYMDENSIYYVSDYDIERLRYREHILQELEDIDKGKDLNDPRVLAYCQPVYNLATGKYDTAEALMRLHLEGLGMVPPNQFIPLAEEYGYIHTLTEIILHKTCEEIRRLMEEGYIVCRISVNVSALELKSDQFCDDISGIIEASGIPGDKVAIELTESQTEDDFLVMRDKINQLRKKGLKFYLDDFGTGYSNMERIMELPFDIIKFDRSLVLASDASERSRQIVSGLASMFSRMKYAVLYEGVEQEDEEKMCIGMDASFLQGYKYSRPVPITELKHYFERVS